MIESILSVIFTILILLHTSWMVILLYPKRNKYAESSSFSTKTPGVSFILPAHNEEKFIEKTIERILSADYPSDKKEIIVVNDNSGDKTEDLVRKISAKDKRVKLVSTKGHFGKAKAVNLGLLKAKSEIVIILDADSELKSDAIKKIMRPFDDSTVSAVSGVIRAVDTKNPMTWFQDFEYILSSSWRFICSKVDGTYIFPGFAAFRKNVLQDIGGFSEDTFSEDFDIGLRLRKKGYGLEMSTATIYTRVPETISGFVRQRLRWGRGTVQVMRKHSGLILNRHYGAVGLYGLPTQIYWYLHGFIYIPIVFYQVLSGYMQYFVSNNNYLSLDAVKYFFSWFSAYGAFEYFYKTLTGLYEMRPSFYFLFFMFFLYIIYDILMLMKFSKITLKYFFVILFYFPYSMISLSLQAIALLYEVRFWKKEGTNVWEKSI